MMRALALRSSGIALPSPNSLSRRLGFWAHDTAPANWLASDIRPPLWMAVQKTKLPRCVRLDAERRFDSIGDGLAFARADQFRSLDLAGSGLLAFCSPRPVRCRSRTRRGDRSHN